MTGGNKCTENRCIAGIAKALLWEEGTNKCGKGGGIASSCVIMGLCDNKYTARRVGERDAERVGSSHRSMQSDASQNLPTNVLPLLITSVVPAQFGGPGAVWEVYDKFPDVDELEQYTMVIPGILAQYYLAALEFKKHWYPRLPSRRD